MRPLRLELEGFASFRERTEIDFRDADLFVLTGPTGSGKSSIIDAIAFALYGSVPRYDDRRLVEPVVTRGVSRARVSLEFAVGGREYTAVRVVRVSKGRAITEARLECEGEVLAGTADELSAKAAELLGLEFDQFIKCVVLPQGDFAQLLHARASERQKLLVRLLDAEQFSRIGRLAGERAERLKAEAAAQERHRERVRDSARRNVDLLLGRIVEDVEGDPAALLDECQGRVAALAALVERLVSDEERLQALAQAEAEARRELARQEEAVRLLSGIVMPPAVPGLAAKVASARAMATAADEAHARALAAVQEAEEALKALPRADDLTLARENHRSANELAKALAAAQQTLAREERQLAEAKARADDAEQRFQQATEAYRELRRVDMAGALAAGVQPGDRCPVCGEVVTRDLASERPSTEALRDADAARNEAKARANELRQQAEEIARRREARASDVRTFDEQLGRLRERLAGAPPLAEIEALLARISAAEGACDRARQEERARRREREQAFAAVERNQDDERRAWAAFDRARDAVAAFGAPATERRDLRESWETLTAWAQAETETYRSKCERASALAEARLAERRALEGEQAAACQAMRVPIEARSTPRDAAVAALSIARRCHESLGEDVASLRAISADIQRTAEAATVAETLARRLQARNFEKWYLNEALQRLAARASTRLLELSGEQFSLAASADGDLEVIDHGNADEHRPVKTLSGGETFLASLSLALALADEVRLLAPGTATQLDALFLDEGFGTLDAETLETVAVAIENLGASGRMVGIITHVRELAERIPVRFQVRRDDRSSRVTRVEA